MCISRQLYLKLITSDACHKTYIKQSIFSDAFTPIIELDIQSNLSTTAKHGDKRVGLCREFDLISEFFR